MKTKDLMYWCAIAVGALALLLIAGVFAFGWWLKAPFRAERAHLNDPTVYQQIVPQIIEVFETIPETTFDPTDKLESPILGILKAEPYSYAWRSDDIFRIE